jgi:hypothetical protein
MLSVKVCKSILEKSGRKYTEEEVKIIRAFLYTLGQIDYEHFKALGDEQKSSSIHTGFNR